MDLNSALRFTAPAIAGSTLATAEVANTNAGLSGTQATVPGGAIGVYITSEGTQDGWVWFLAAGASAPDKGATPTPGFQRMNFGGASNAGHFFFPLDPSDPPTMWLAEAGGSDDTFQLLFVGSTK